MKKPTAVALVVVAIIGGGVVTFNACTSGSLKGQAHLRQPTPTEFTALDVPATIPSAEELFLRGKYFSKNMKADSDVSDGNASLELDLHMNRPVVDMTQSIFGRKYGKQGYTLLGNFFHEGSFYIARIPDTGIKGVFYLLALTPPNLGKSFFGAESKVRIQMDPAHPVEIVAEMPDEAMLKNLKTATAEKALAMLPNENPEGDPRVENFSISAEAVLKKSEAGEPYNLADALRGETTQVLSFQSLEEAYVAFYKTGEPVNEYKLDVGAGEAYQIVAEGVRQSQANGLRKRMTFAANCTSAPFMLLKSALRVNDDRFAYLQKVMEQKSPTPGPKKLVLNGLQGEIPLQLDRSLAPDSNVAFGRVFGGRDSNICKTTAKVYRGYRCDNIRTAVRSLETWGRLPASTKPVAVEEKDRDLAPLLDDKAAAAAEKADKALIRAARKDGRGAASGYESDDVLH